MPTRKVSRTKKTWKRRRDVHKKNLNNPFFKKKAHVAQVIPWRGITFVIICIDIILVAYFLLYSPYFKISNIEVYGVNIEVTEKIRQALHEQLSTSKFGVLPQDSIWLFNEDDAITSISELLSYQTISVQVQKKSLVIIVEELQGAIKWANNSGTNLIGEDGIVIRKLENFEPQVEKVEGKEDIYVTSLIIERDKQPLVYDTSHTHVEIGDTIISPEMLRRILYLSQEFEKEIKIPVTSFELITPQSSQIRINTAQGWHVLVTLGDSDYLSRSILRLQVVLVEKFKEDYSRLQYVDLRNGDKIFYR